VFSNPKYTHRFAYAHARALMLIHNKKVIAEAGVDIYQALFDLVKARLQAVKKD
jgi:hypothetical protein